MGLGETLPCCLSLTQGKMKVIPAFYMSKESNNYGSFFSLEENKKIYSPKNFKYFFKAIKLHLIKYSRNGRKNYNEIFYNYKKAILKRANRKYIKQDKKKLILKKFKNKIGFAIRIRTRFSNLFLDGCHVQLYPKYFNDYKKLKDCVIKEKLGYSLLNQNRLLKKLN